MTKTFSTKNCGSWAGWVKAFNAGGRYGEL